MEPLSSRIEASEVVGYGAIVLLKWLAKDPTNNGKCRIECDRACRTAETAA